MTLTMDNGLINSKGAPRANHERVFGNMRFWMRASPSSRRLVTESASVCAFPFHPLQVELALRLEPIIRLSVVGAVGCS